MLSALLGWSRAIFASKLDVEGEHALITREVGSGLQTINVEMPSIVTVDLRLNEPRYASLPNIIKAKKRPLDEKTAADCGNPLIWFSHSIFCRCRIQLHFESRGSVGGVSLAEV